GGRGGQGGGDRREDGGACRQVGARGRQERDEGGRQVKKGRRRDGSCGWRRLASAQANGAFRIQRWPKGSRKVATRVPQNEFVGLVSPFPPRLVALAKISSTILASAYSRLTETVASPAGIGTLVWPNSGKASASMTEPSLITCSQCMIRMPSKDGMRARWRALKTLV